MKKILLILVVVAAFVAVVLWFTMEKAPRQGQPNGQAPQGQDQGQRQDANDNARETFIEGLKKSKEMHGVVGTIQIPKEGNVRFLQIEADVINTDELKNVDLLKQGNNNIPMKKQTYMVAVDSSTKLENVDKKEDIKSGDLVRVLSAMSVFDVQNFTAVEIEVLASR